ncbi:uncharacterized protein F4822DRAFT_162106 [Hypoxylon trugodes]|uniref:uncharacterized protein n=1 Tax=Hypoxylon trugodes TaxID=326681 RepID=UPI002197DB0F|nr:uncharacterized protein F4822DRAFT_162106 [Hypoxylon trugodes]KAI1390719.1 hypothetical protein F4822DRAFT_162106 [Hypoxylon trugodes]
MASRTSSPNMIPQSWLAGTLKDDGQSTAEASKRCPTCGRAGSSCFMIKILRIDMSIDTPRNDQLPTESIIFPERWRPEDLIIAHLGSETQENLISRQWLENNIPQQLQILFGDGRNMQLLWKFPRGRYEFQTAHRVVDIKDGHGITFNRKIPTSASNDVFFEEELAQYPRRRITGKMAMMEVKERVSRVLQKFLHLRRAMEGSAGKVKADSIRLGGVLRRDNSEDHSQSAIPSMRKEIDSQLEGNSSASSEGNLTAERGFSVSSIASKSSVPATDLTSQLYSDPDSFHQPLSRANNDEARGLNTICCQNILHSPSISPADPETFLTKDGNRPGPDVCELVHRAWATQQDPQANCLSRNASTSEARLTSYAEYDTLDSMCSENNGAAPRLQYSCDGDGTQATTCLTSHDGQANTYCNPIIPPVSLSDQGDCGSVCLRSPEIPPDGQDEQDSSSMLSTISSLGSDIPYPDNYWTWSTEQNNYFHTETGSDGTEVTIWYPRKFS